MAESPFEAGSEAVALAVTGFAGDHFTVVFHCIGRRVSHICIEELMKCRDIGLSLIHISEPTRRS